MTTDVIAGQNQTAPVYSIQIYIQKIFSNSNYLSYEPSEGDLKTRKNNHAKSFRHTDCMHETENI